MKSHALAPKQRYLNFPCNPRHMLRNRNQTLSLQSSQSGAVTMETIRQHTRLQRLIFFLSPFPFFRFTSTSVPCLHLISPLGGDPNETDCFFFVFFLVDLEISAKLRFALYISLTLNDPTVCLPLAASGGVKRELICGHMIAVVNVKWKLGGRFDRI